MCRKAEALDLWAVELPPHTGAAQTWHSALPVQWHSSTWIGDRSIEWQRRRKRRETVLHLDIVSPTRITPSIARNRGAGCTTRTRWNCRNTAHLDLDRRPWWHEASLTGKPMVDDPEIRRYRLKGQRVPPQTDMQLRDMTTNYYGMISLIDHNVGRILDALAVNGQAENTIVVFASDHGDMLGDHGLYLKGPTLYEGVLRVGLIVQGPGIPAGKIVGDPVSTLDLTPFFYDWAGLATPDDLQGQSLQPLIAGDPGAARAVAHSEWFVHKSRSGIDLDLRLVRTATHKCTFEMLSGAGELYDLVNDPTEMDNLFDDPGSAPVRQELEVALRSRPGPILKTFPLQIGMA